MSIEGGAWKAVERAVKAGADCLQVFVKSNLQWQAPEVTDAQAERFRAACRRAKMKAVFGHCSYLVNIATHEAEKHEMSRASLKAELALAARYGIPWLVLHPGGHRGAGMEAGMARAAGSIREALDEAPEAVGMLLETTAGAGTALCSRFEEISELIERVGGERLGMCLDTSHVFVAGYDISTEEGYAQMKERLRDMGLIERLRVIHTNDSTGVAGSHFDKHAHIGKGRIGRRAFELLMRDADLARVPRILETPKGRCGRRDCDAVNISLLRRLAART
jgi:deoxyribonuclease-4